MSINNVYKYKLGSSFSNSKKKEIAKRLKNISEDDAIIDYLKLQEINVNDIRSETRIGNKFVDYFTFEPRLETISKRGLNFFQFLQDKEYHKKPYIKKLIDSQNDKDKDLTIYRVFKLHCGSIGIFKPVTALEVFEKYNPFSVLDFTMGWGGRLVGACVANIPNYIGIDSNLSLKIPYQQMVEVIEEIGTETKIHLIFRDALKVDYSKLDYDMVFTSPPYYNTEIYEHMKPKDYYQWNEKFYIPLFSKTYKYLKKHGYYILNVQKDLYQSVCIPLFGKATNKILLKNKRKPKNQKSPDDYNEYLYVWKK